jgi:hypothetical protein
LSALKEVRTFDWKILEGREVNWLPLKLIDEKGIFAKEAGTSPARLLYTNSMDSIAS